MSLSIITLYEATLWTTPLQMKLSSLGSSRCMLSLRNGDEEAAFLYSVTLYILRVRVVWCGVHLLESSATPGTERERNNGCFCFAWRAGKITFQPRDVVRERERKKDLANVDSNLPFFKLLASSSSSSSSSCFQTHDFQKIIRRERETNFAPKKKHGRNIRLRLETSDIKIDAH